MVDHIVFSSIDRGRFMVDLLVDSLLADGGLEAALEAFLLSMMNRFLYIRYWADR